jgi:molecular chaperone GrpE
MNTQPSEQPINPEVTDNVEVLTVTPEAQIEKLQQELAQMKDQWLRTVADGENIRKRAEREIQEARKYAVGEFARDMIGVAENLKRALECTTPAALDAEGAGLLKTIYSGVDMTLKDLLSTFERYGLKRLDPKGQPFDHNVHQAVAQVEDVSVPAGNVVQVIQAGYTLHDRLLVPAMVAVAKAPADQPAHLDTKV